MGERTGKDYLHRTSPGGTERALGHVAFLRNEPFRPMVGVPEFVGALGPLERADVAEKIAEEFGWLTLSEIGTKVGVRDAWDVERLPVDLLGVRVVGAKICPGFVINETEDDGRQSAVDDAIMTASRRFAGILTDWEQIAWFVRENGGSRPVDLTPERLGELVDAELVRRGRGGT